MTDKKVFAIAFAVTMIATILSVVGFAWKVSQNNPASVGGVLLLGFLLVMFIGFLFAMMGEGSINKDQNNVTLPESPAIPETSGVLVLE